MKQRVGFMQGRLSPPIDGRIQAFPWSCWQEEFQIGASLGFRHLEWTLDQDRLYENPLLTRAGQVQIRALCSEYGFAIPSLTGDCFMQAPFWKAQGTQRAALQLDFQKIVEACATVEIRTIVVPLVDAGRLEDSAQESILISYLNSQADVLRERGIRISFESDFSPTELRRFIDSLEPASFGINYDIGNSAAMGFDPSEELACYGNRVINVHVKDRKLGGTTVPLGTGNADFDAVFAGLATSGYNGIYILQTARAADGDHAEVLCRYRDMTVSWLSRHAA